MHKLRQYLLLLALAPTLLFGQLTIQITSIPANTPAPDQLYLVGNFNNWNPGDNNYRFTALENGQYSITLKPQAGFLEYKITRGSWATVEGNESGKFRPNRTLQYDGKPKTIQVSIPAWEDRDTGGGGTAAPNVFILADKFYMPQLKRSRRIWVYLPPDYATSKKRYPVLYLHDGQNMFDNQTSSFGEWQIDEALNNMFNQGDYGCIAIGIDNGEGARLDEYSPWVNEEYGGGQGKKYLDFLVNTLKPYVDSIYRTLPGPQTTAILGSSMGGLISMYAFTERPDVYSMAGVFSPAFWFAGDSVALDVRNHPKRYPGKMYFLAGGQEPDYVESDLVQVGNAMLSAGFQPTDIYFTMPADGQHSEWFWRREFPAAYRWLFAGAVSTTRRQASVGFDLDIAAGTEGRTYTIAGIGPKEKVEFKLVDVQGHVWKSWKQRGGTVQLDTLPKGEYSLLVKMRKQNWKMGELIKN
ncbi:MAG: alpha/beta hydrolase [Lewinellaceae bacterium]|nr:alpha/beta hydrolase [Saprospiraceae bacterium]MCB9334114.1 alpha/beta hydrolase [Lewinellaceae bacterium]